jgi:hypothetical protein
LRTPAARLNAAKPCRLNETDAYERLFSAIVSEQQVLTDLYAPDAAARRVIWNAPEAQLQRDPGRRFWPAWATMAEDHLIDCRRSGPFYGRGSLVEARRNRFEAGLGDGIGDRCP